MRYTPKPIYPAWHPDPDDRMEHQDAIHAREAILALWQVQQMLRGYWKYQDLGGMTADELIDKLWREFHDIAGAVLETTE